MATFDALTVDGSGTVWRPRSTGRCASSRILRPTATTSSNACLTIPDDTATPAPTFTATLATDACTLFGPMRRRR